MVPLVIILILIAWTLIKKVFPFSQKTIELKIEGEMKRGKETTLVIVTMVITILLWMMDTLTGINTYTVALIPFAVFAMAGIITKYDLDEINWSVIWMVAGGFALGYAMNGSGLAALVVRAIPFGSFSPLLIVILSGLLCYTLSNLISHSATAALIMPILVVVCTAMGDKLAAIGGTSTVLIGVAIASSSAMILPISTPPNALAYATNLIQQKDMAKMGIVIGIISILLGYLVLFAAGSLHIV
jgi:sodium-dependent dicarboxylate transporter 2/3/5